MHKIHLWITAVLLVILTMLGLAYGLKSGSNMLIGGLILVPFILLLVNKPAWAVVLTLIVYPSKIKAIGGFNQLEMFHLLAMGVIALSIMARTIQKQRRHIDLGLRLWLYAFGFVLFITIMIRGAGFQALGDTNWGGIRYVTLGIALMFLLHIQTFNLSAKQWLVILVGMQIAALLPSLVEGLFLVSKGKIWWQYKFFQFTAGTAHNYGSFVADGMGRFNRAAFAGKAMILLPFILFPFKGKYRLFHFIFLALGFSLLALSGFRLGMISAIAVVWLWGLFHYQKSRGLYLSLSCLAGGVVYILLLFTIPELPFPMQRSLSWIPGVQIDPAAMQDAHSTVTWRLTLWKDALDLIPEYFWIGRGYTFRGDLLHTTRLLGQTEYVRSWALITADYHNGFLSLLIGMGVFGLISGVGFLVYAALRHLRTVCRVDATSVITRGQQILGISLLIQIATFFLIYGDVYTSFLKFFIELSVLEGLLFYTQKDSASSSRLPQGLPNTS